MGHPPRLPVWLRWDQSVIYFVTNCVADRKPVLARGVKVARVTGHGGYSHARHLHVVFAPTKEREAKLGNFSAALKRWMRQELKPSWK